jgi:hypothetical protein
MVEIEEGRKFSKGRKARVPSMVSGPCFVQRGEILVSDSAVRWWVLQDVQPLRPGRWGSTRPQHPKPTTPVRGEVLPGVLVGDRLCRSAPGTNSFLNCNSNNRNCPGYVGHRTLYWLNREAAF